jgi:hypothetical protein
MGTYKNNIRGIHIIREAKRNLSLIKEEAKKGNLLLLQV